MRYNLRWFIVPLLLLTLTVSVAGQPMSRMESEYNRVAALFEQRDKLALRELRDYIEAYPYTTFEAEVYFMQGVIQTERGYYKKAIKEFCTNITWKSYNKASNFPCLIKSIKKFIIIKKLVTKIKNNPVIIFLTLIIKNRLMNKESVNKHKIEG